MIGIEVRAEIGYVRREEIGRGEGRNSTVYRVFDHRLNGEFAAKEIVKKEFIRPPDEFFVEAQSMFASEHPNVVPIRCCCETDELVCMLMPLYKNGSLGKRIATNPISLEEVIKVGRETLMGLSRIHLARRLHLDIKPSNVFFGDDGAALVADFGQSCIVGADGIATPPPMYHFAMPPEFFTYHAVSNASDIYQIAVTLYRAVNGDPFFASQKPKRQSLPEAVVSGKFPDRSAFLPHVPKRLRKIIRKAMSVESEDRYQTAQEFSNELGKVRIPINWKVNYVPNGTTEWRGKPPRRSETIVQLHNKGDEWQLEIFKECNGRRQRQNRLCEKFQSQKDAYSHLKSLFEVMG